MSLFISNSLGSSTNNYTYSANDEKLKDYPFGIIFTESNMGDSKVQPYKYNGKEFDGKCGLNVYDYGGLQHRMRVYNVII
ncbi:MAG: hypothetical protein ACK5ND_04305 [Bacteroides sp.]